MLMTSATGLAIAVGIELPSPMPVSTTGETASSIASSTSPEQLPAILHTGQAIICACGATPCMRTPPGGGPKGVLPVGVTSGVFASTT
jgi:hypothetical protein